MPLDPKEFDKVFTNHFETIAPEQFLDNLKKSCPYLFAEDLTVNTKEINNKEDLAKWIALTDDRVEHSS